MTSLSVWLFLKCKTDLLFSYFSLQLTWTMSGSRHTGLPWNSAGCRKLSAVSMCPCLTYCWEDLDQCTGALTTFRSSNTLLHITQLLLGAWKPLAWRVFRCHQFTRSLWNLSAGWFADLPLLRQQWIRNKATIPCAFLIFILFSQILSLCSLLEPHPLSVSRGSSPAEQYWCVWEQWEFGWNNRSRSEVANGLWSWILNPEGLLPLNEIIIINI